MRVLIFTEGGANIGFGHINRCKALYQGFREQGKLAQLIVNGDNTVEALLEDVEHELYNWIEDKHKTYALLEAADIVLIDSYLAGLEFYEKLSKMVNMPVYIDDNKRIDYPKGIVINGSIYAQNIGYPEIKGNIYLLGVQYAFLRKEFWEIEKRKVNKKVENILITFGGDDDKNMIPKVLSFLNKEYPHLIKNVVIGKGSKNIQEVESCKTSNTVLVYYPNAQKMKDIMLACDMAITAAGTTLYELARIGVPAIAITVADNQLNNALSWRSAGFIEYAGSDESPELWEKIKFAMEAILPYEERVKRVDIAQDSVDGQGARRIVDNIITRYEDKP